MATPVHNHTTYSLLDGLARADEIAERAEQLGFEAVGCTDHDVVSGHPDFFKALTAKNLKPLLGIEAYQAPTTRFEHEKTMNDKETGLRIDNFHLVLLAQTQEGLRNLWRLNSESHDPDAFWHHGRVDWELLEKHNEGILATSSCIQGVLSQAILSGDNPERVLQRYLDIFGDRFYVEIHTWQDESQKTVNLELMKLVQQYGVPAIYANDAHYAFPEQFEMHNDVLMKPKGMEYSPGLHIMSEDEVREALDYLPKSFVDEVISNSDDLAARCDVRMPERRMRVPVFVPGNEWGTAKDMLYDLAVQGYMKKVAERGLHSDEYFERFEKELAVIYDANLVDYFLIVWDYCKFADEHGIMRGPGRGSIGGSLIAWLLGITEIDPIKFGLIFERFYNAGREASMPDIDIDFPNEGRDKVFDYVSRKYGPEYVTNLCNFNTMRGRAAIKKVGAALKLPPNDMDSIGKIIEDAIESGLQPKWEDIWEKLGDQLEPWVKKYPKLFEYAEDMYDHVYAYGVHASGVIIGDEPLAETYPLRWNPKQKKLVSQFDMDVADEWGYMKVDLLGIAKLDMLEEYNKLLVEKGKEPVDWNWVIHHEDEHPEEMWQLLDKGMTIGLWQIEDGSTAKRLAKEIKPRSIAELGLIVAINRPGPLIAGSDRRYVAVKEGRADPLSINPLFSKATEETNGEIIYQEQISYFLEYIGYDLAEADRFRKAVGKKKRAEMAAEYELFVERATAHMDKDTAQTIWDTIEGFAKYGFNKSHAIAYGMITLMTTYAKWHDPVTFTVAGIRTVTKMKQREKVALYVNDAYRMGIKVLAPHINLSDVDVNEVGENEIRYGLANIKGITAAPGRWLVSNRPDDGYLNREHIEDLLQENKIRLPNGNRRVAVHSGQLDALVNLNAIPNETGLTGDELLDYEEEVLGIALSDDSSKILEEYSDIVEELCTPFDQLEEEGEYNIAGVVRGFRYGKTSKGKKMARVDIENHGIQITAAVWDNNMKRLDFIFRRRQAGIFHVKKGARGFSLDNAQALFSKEAKGRLSERVGVSG